MSSFWVTLGFFAFIAVGVACVLYFNKVTREAGEAHEDSLRRLGHSGPFNSLSTESGPQGPWLFQSSAENAAWYFSPGISTPLEINSGNLLSVDLYEDGTSVVKSRRGRQVGGAIVGGVIAGPAGAVIGGLGTKRTSRDHVNRVDLRIALKDDSTPIIDFPMFRKMGNGVEKNNPLYQEAERKARTWHAVLSSLLDTNGSPGI